MSPELTPVSRLSEGQVGYLVANMKNAKDALIGDTYCLADDIVEPLPGFKSAQPMVGTFFTHSVVCYIVYFVTPCFGHLVVT